MRYTRFQDLPVWQLAVSLYEWSRALGLKGATGEVVMQDELERFALGISTQIAQSFERGGKLAMLDHVENASALTAGLRSMISILQQRENSPETTMQLSELRDGTVSCSRQLHAWTEVVRRSGLEEPERPAPSPERLKRLLENLPSSHPLRSDPVP